MFLFGLIALVSGALFGAVPTSIPQIILAANWLLEGNFLSKYKQLKSNTIFLVLISVYLLHLIGMLYTANINDGLNDLKIKMPLIILPIILFTTQAISKKELNWLFKFFFLSVVVSSICCFIVYLGYTKKTITDIRQASVFMSHIRFSLYIVFAICAMFYFVLKEISTYKKIILLFTICWLLYFLYKLQMVTGLSILFFLILLYGIIALYKYLNFKYAIILTSCLIAGLMYVSSVVYSSLTMYSPNNKLVTNKRLTKTINGHFYFHDTLYNLAENGNLTAININHYELFTAWNKRSALSLDRDYNKGYLNYYAALRYLASKGLTKDSVGVSKLTNDDVKNIEQGITNYKYTFNTGANARWREIVWEYTLYKRSENPSGHTLTMRFEFWKTAIHVIKANLIFGVGTGDIQNCLNKAYTDTKSQLSVDWHKRCHNQYLAITVAFGLCGLVLFLIYLCYPAITLQNNLHALFWPFFIIAIISFLTEDTLETQAGVTFFSLFYFMFLWLSQTKPASIKNKDADLKL